MTYFPTPDVCQLCGGRVEYVDNSRIYGKNYGSGYAYQCTKCGAYVGTHKPYPEIALGVLANSRMRSMKVVCHDLFDKHWKFKPEGQKTRSKLYEWLAKEMKIPVSECHFGFFDLPQLLQAAELLRRVQYATMQFDKHGNLYFKKEEIIVPISERTCNKCGSSFLGVRPNPKNAMHTDLVCLKCGAWQKFATKDEKRYFEVKNNESK